jgi:hypothetical protein
VAVPLLDGSRTGNIFSGRPFEIPDNRRGNMSIAERLLELKHSGQPFVVHLNCGRALRIRAALLARTVIVIENDSGYVDIVPHSAIRRPRVLQ